MNIIPQPIRTVRAATALATLLGMRIHVVYGGEYRVTATIDTIRTKCPNISYQQAITTAESIAYYTDDLTDAVQTMQQMHAQHFAMITHITA